MCVGRLGWHRDGMRKAEAGYAQTLNLIMDLLAGDGSVLSTAEYTAGCRVNNRMNSTVV